MQSHHIQPYDNIVQFSLFTSILSFTTFVSIEEHPDLGRFILFFIPGISDEERFVRKKKNVVTTGISVTKHSQEL